MSANAACRCRPRFSLAAQGVHISNIYMIGRCKASHLSLFRNFCIFFFVLSGLPYAVFPSGGRCVRTRVLAAAETTRFLPVAEHLQKTMSMLKCEYSVPINIRKKDFLLMLLAIGLQCTSFFSFSRLHFSSGNVTPRPVHTAFVPPLDLSRSSYYCSLLCTRQYSIIPTIFIWCN